MVIKMEEIYKYLDHYAILSWCSYMSHRVAVGKANTNFDGREYIQLPSGQKITITITVEEYNEHE